MLYVSILVLANAICVPSGDHRGWISSEESSSGVDVSCVWSLPSAFITQMRQRPPPAGAREYTIFVPSGDQAGLCSQAPVHVSLRSALPSAFAE